MAELVADLEAIEADLERFGVGSRMTLDVENIRDLIFEVRKLRALMAAAVECPLLANACEHTRAMAKAVASRAGPG